MLALLGFGLLQLATLAKHRLYRTVYLRKKVRAGVCSTVFAIATKKELAEAFLQFLQPQDCRAHPGRFCTGQPLGVSMR